MVGSILALEVNPLPNRKTELARHFVNRLERWGVDATLDQAQKLP
jgi:hypothetical protein